MQDEKLITAILTQAVEDAKYTGTNKKKLKHKIEALRWIEDDDPQFKYYCRLLNIEPNYIKNKLDRNADSKISKEQQPIAAIVISAMLKNMKNEKRRR
jgi:hypothetical protein|tara:strand:- start:220 stop:513 length:294 start_codon:yes stop_codon:yes gene_type:complete